MPAGAAELLLELSAAALAAGRHLQRRPRARLEAAVAGVLALVKSEQHRAETVSPERALAKLRAALDLCKAAGVAWPDIVAIVNHEEGF
jgi:hypothetical protein